MPFYCALKKFRSDCNFISFRYSCITYEYIARLSTTRGFTDVFQRAADCSRFTLSYSLLTKLEGTSSVQKVDCVTGNLADNSA